MNSALGQEAVHVPHCMQTRMPSPPGMAQISLTNGRGLTAGSIIARYSSASTILRLFFSLYHFFM